MCGVLLGLRCALFSSPKLTWEIDLPDLSERKSCHKNDDESPHERPELFSAVQITDIHVDPFYHVGTNSDCGEPVCCRSDSQLAFASNEAAGAWGNYGKCDMPLSTVANAFQRIADEHPNVS